MLFINITGFWNLWGLGGLKFAFAMRQRLILSGRKSKRLHSWLVGHRGLECKLQFANISLTSCHWTDALGWYESRRWGVWERNSPAPIPAPTLTGGGKWDKISVEQIEREFLKYFPQWHPAQHHWTTSRITWKNGMGLSITRQGDFEERMKNHPFGWAKHFLWLKGNYRSSFLRWKGKIFTSR